MSQQNPYTISPIAAAVSAAIATPGAALAQQDDTAAALDEIIVTATKREQNLQKIPASVNALPEAMLKDIGALNTEDYVRFLPSVNWINYNTGGNNVVIFRGVNTDTSGGFTGTQTSSVYLDEIPITATDGTQPDIRMLDVQRTEALSGPQGTLFGAAAQAGTLRIITNKPDASKFEASGEVMFRTGEESDPSHSVTGVFNIPLVEDVFAVRIAAESAEDGGYIDNVPGHTPDMRFGITPAEYAATVYAGPWGWGAPRLEWGNLRNDDVVEENWNSAEFTNLRVSARWHINDDWMVTAAYHYGDTESQGSSGYNPFVGDLQTIGWVKNQSHSEWDMKALTIEADFEFAQFVSATSFYQNQRTYQIDNTLYYKYYSSNYYCTDHGAFNQAYYWYWENQATGRAVYNPLYCVIPVANPSGDFTQIPDFAGVGKGPEWQERFSQEFRLSHQGDSFDWLAGLYYEDSKDNWDSVWMENAKLPYQQTMSYAFIADCVEGTSFSANNMWACGPNWLGGADPAVLASVVENADHYWDSRDRTNWEQKAVFGEVTWHATDQLNVTFGGRWFETTNDKLYVKMIAGSTAPNGIHYGGYLQPLWRGNDVVQKAESSEFVPKLSIDYSIDDDKMVYGLYTEGWRVGGINRANRRADWTRTLWGQEWDPDKLANYEFGYKSRLLDNTMQLNVTTFHMEWENFQHEVVDPSGGDCIVPAEAPDCPIAQGGTGLLPWISIVGNVGDAHITGVTADLDWIPADGWHVGANAQWLEAEIDSTTSDERAGIEKGQKMPSVPEFQGSLWATYTWPVEFIPGAEMFVRGQYSFTGETHTLLVPAPLTDPNPSFDNDSYGLADLRFGLVAANGQWQVDLFVSNITDERAQLDQGSTFAYMWGRTGEYEHAHTVYTVRPREYGLRISARWGE
jgi:outer membrane receptor protein involved in Fe transport